MRFIIKDSTTNNIISSAKTVEKLSNKKKLYLYDKERKIKENII